MGIIPIDQMAARAAMGDQRQQIDLSPLVNDLLQGFSVVMGQTVNALGSLYSDRTIAASMATMMAADPELTDREAARRVLGLIDALDIEAVEWNERRKRENEPAAAPDVSSE